LKLPEVEVPKRKGKRGLHPTWKQLIEEESEPIKVWKIVEKLPDAAWSHIPLRDTERKEIDIRDTNA